MDETNQNPNTNQQIITNDQMEHMFLLLLQMNRTTRNSDLSAPKLKVAEKLNYQNYTNWCKLIYIAKKLWDSSITSSPPSQPTDPSEWTQRDSVVRLWLIANIDIYLVHHFLDYSTWEL